MIPRPNASPKAMALLYGQAVPLRGTALGRGMIILGLDPGLNATGYGVILARDSEARFIAAGTLRPPARHPLSRRLLFLYDGLANVIDSHHPTTVVLEAVFIHHDYLTTAALMAHARGVACLLSAQHKIELVEYLPTRIKKALSGYGRASKEQVARVVGQWLGVRDPSWSSDATDALALAIAHAHICRSQDRLRPAMPRSRRPDVLAALARVAR